MAVGGFFKRFGSVLGESVGPYLLYRRSTWIGLGTVAAVVGTVLLITQ